MAAVPLGIIASPFIGKQTRVFDAVRAMCRLGLTQRPRGASWRQIYGVAILCGIGFTMSPFIAGLAFGNGGANNGVA
nr:Na+/H+ antiporter NhaA [Polymorphobacter sp.]